MRAGSFTPYGSYSNILNVITDVSPIIDRPEAGGYVAIA
jgi:hypothetical protein